MTINNSTFKTIYQQLCHLSKQQIFNLFWCQIFFHVQCSNNPYVLHSVETHFFGNVQQNCEVRRQIRQSFRRKLKLLSLLWSSESQLCLHFDIVSSKSNTLLSLQEVYSTSYKKSFQQPLDLQIFAAMTQQQHQTS